jgi:hypothetical protein
MTSRPYKSQFSKNPLSVEPGFSTGKYQQQKNKREMELRKYENRV